MIAPVVVFAIGNRSRGDDALGPLLGERLVARLEADGRAADVEVIEEFQLQIEHALDLAHRSLALFVDAGADTPPPYTLGPIEACAPGRSHTTHALAPEAVLGVYRQVNRAEPPPAFVLCVRGESFELGEGLGADARDRLEAAWRTLVALVERPDPEFWRAAATHPAGGCPASGDPAAAYR